MAAKHYSSIDFIIEGFVYYSSKALIESSIKAIKQPALVVILIENL
jgi:hypothetical protein